MGKEGDSMDWLVFIGKVALAGFAWAIINALSMMIVAWNIM